MRKLYKLFGIIVIAAVMLSVSSCAMLSTYGGTGDVHGLFTFSVPTATDGYVDIGSYIVILGLFDSGYKEYAAKIKEGEAAGWQITSVTKFYYFFTKTTAYAK